MTTLLLITVAWTLVAVTYACLPPWPWPMRLGCASLAVTLALLMVGALLRVATEPQAQTGTTTQGQD